MLSSTSSHVWCLCDSVGLGWVVTVIVRLEALKLVDDCLMKTVGPLFPFTRTTNSSDGILSMRTKKFPLPCDATTPLISPDPDDSTRATSVTVAESLPVKDTNKLPLTPFLKQKWNVTCLNRQYYFISAYLQSNILTVSFTRSGTSVKSIISWERALRGLHKVKQEVKRTLTCKSKVVRKKGLVYIYRVSFKNPFRQS